MKALQSLTSGAAAALLLFAASADAQTRQFGPRNAVPGYQSGGFVGGKFHSGKFHGGKHHGGKFHGGKFRGGNFHGGHFGGLFLVEREVVHVVEVAVPAAAPAVPPPPPAPPPARKPYVLGKSYSSLPGGCMKLIEGGASYYYCGGGEWYRQLGKQYKAVAKP